MLCLKCVQGSSLRESESCSVMSDYLWLHGLHSPWNSPGQNIGMDSLSLLQGIFPMQGLNPGLPHCRQILYQLSHQGSPRILEWVASPFSSGSSQSRNQTGVSCIAGRFFTNWTMREALQRAIVEGKVSKTGKNMPASWPLLWGSPSILKILLRSLLKCIS